MYGNGFANIDYQTIQIQQWEGPWFSEHYTYNGLGTRGSPNITNTEAWMSMAHQTLHIQLFGRIAHQPLQYISSKIHGSPNATYTEVCGHMANQTVQKHVFRMFHMFSMFSMFCMFCLGCKFSMCFEFCRLFNFYRFAMFFMFYLFSLFARFDCFQCFPCFPGRCQGGRGRPKSLTMPVPLSIFLTQFNISTLPLFLLFQVHKPAKKKTS